MSLLHTRISLLLGRFAPLLGAVVFLLSPLSANAAQVQVVIGDNTFTPGTVNIHGGDIVVWTNQGKIAHTVTADNGSFKSGAIQPGSVFTQTFSANGSYSYHCDYHQGQNGVVIVSDSAVSASGSSNADLQAQTEALLQKVANLQKQLAGSGGTSAGANVSAQAGARAVGGSSASGCPTFSRTLKLGSRGADVTALQTYLAQDPSIYADGSVSGYFGALTQAAVQKFQARAGIVSSGSPSTNGFGAVGPKTGAAITQACGGGGNSTVGGFIQVSPISGNAPLTVSVQATVNTTNSCTGAIYTLDWGDQTAPVSVPVSANNCSQVSNAYTHTYQQQGNYSITLAAGAHKTNATVAVYGPNASAPITPGTTPANTGNPALATVPPASISASPQSGSAPFVVSFTGIVNGQSKGWCAAGCADTINFGDGATAQIPLPPLQNGWQSYSITHTYQSAGNFTASLQQGSAGTGATVGTLTISVSGTQSAFTAPTVTSNVGGNARSVNVGFNLTTSCTGYDLSWGDGSSDATQNDGGSSCGQQPGSANYTHTYSSTGTFVITLRRGPSLQTLNTNTIVVSN